MSAVGKLQVRRMLDDAWAGLTPQGPLTVPACGAEHAWFAREAWVHEPGARARQPDGH